MGNYIDEKHTIWVRNHYPDDADMEQIAYDMLAGKEMPEPKSTEYLMETLDSIKPMRHKGPTIEVFSKEDFIWNNKRKHVIKRYGFYRSNLILIVKEIKNKIKKGEDTEYLEDDIIRKTYELDSSIEITKSIKTSFRVIKGKICKDLGVYAPYSRTYKTLNFQLIEEE